jgi:hypothetical protein
VKILVNRRQKYKGGKIMECIRIFGKSIFFLFLSVCSIYSQVDLGADVVSRYVWRGQDVGNSASVQPSLSYSLGSFTAGVWGSYALTASGAGFNENDLYLSYSFEPFNFTLTDYYYPENNNMFEFSPDSGYHVLELGLGYSYHKVRLLFAVNLLGDLNDQSNSRNSFYSEIEYLILRKDEIDVHLLVGAGNEVYVSDNDGDFTLVNLGIMVKKERYNLSYSINPELETSFLVFKVTF